MKGPMLVDQLQADEKLSAWEAPRVAMLANLAEAGRPIAAAARAAGLTLPEARAFARRFSIQFQPGGPA